LVGENGAGKSTLMRILSGLDQPDQGTIVFKGKQVRFQRPHQALQAGISMIHQELLPFPELSVAENIFMGHEPASQWLGWINQRQMHRQTQTLLEPLGMSLPPARLMKELSVAEMQTVEIAKALAHRAEVIIMDEPTSSISNREVAALFKIIGDLRRRGVAVIYISHKLEEIFSIADVVTVLRDGQHIATCDCAGLDESRLIGLMVGREFSSLFPKSTANPGEEILSVHGLSQPGRFWDVHFKVRQGEILGVAGLMGSGRTDLVSAVFGMAPAARGEIRIHGQPVRIASPRDALRHRIAMVSEDRKKYGLVLSMSVMENMTLSSLRRLCPSVFINRGQETALAEEQIQAFSIRARSGEETVHSLSGGNQQKVVLAKALLTHPSILILDEPTRGIDINAKAEIYQLISRLAHEGMAILLVSSELPEILSLSDRIMVLREGRVAAELESRKTTQEEIMQHAMPV
jgi:inositol transport system ATP-binding protein